jgi:2-isopropylmalate synthase
VGSSYKETVRVNSQSGKGGVGFLLEEVYGISLPRELLVQFSSVIQGMTETLDREIKPVEIYESLIATYVVDQSPYRLIDYDLLPGRDKDQRCVARVEISENVITIDGQGSGPIEAFVNAMVETLNEPLMVVEYQETAIEGGSDAQAICVLAVEDIDGSGKSYGIGISRNTITAGLNAIIAAINRRWSND